jgi:hypothetical protein
MQSWARLGEAMKLLLMCGSVFAAVFVGGLLVTKGEPSPRRPAAPAQASAALYVARVVDAALPSSSPTFVAPALAAGTITPASASTKTLIGSEWRC